MSQSHHISYSYRHKIALLKSIWLIWIFMYMNSSVYTIMYMHVHAYKKDMLGEERECCQMSKEKVPSGVSCLSIYNFHEQVAHGRKFIVTPSWWCLYIVDVGLGERGGIMSAYFWPLIMKHRCAHVDGRLAFAVQNAIYMNTASAHCFLLLPSKWREKNVIVFSFFLPFPHTDSYIYVRDSHKLHDDLRIACGFHCGKFSTLTQVDLHSQWNMRLNE